MYIRGVFRMVSAMIEIPSEANQVLNIVKARHNLKTKSEAIAFVALEYGATMLEPEIRPEYLAKLARLKKEKGIPFKSMAELRKIIEG